MNLTENWIIILNFFNLHNFFLGGVKRGEKLQTNHVTLQTNHVTLQTNHVAAAAMTLQQGRRNLPADVQNPRVVKTRAHQTVMTLHLHLTVTTHQVMSHHHPPVRVTHSHQVLRQELLFYYLLNPRLLLFSILKWGLNVEIVVWIRIIEDPN